ncbi:MAG TPA: hypothetical protein VHB20_06775 [Verrucomicrobiae bacterium]|jgi:hypothetical protein|nr:hypothetical protein [Verrucomicrobiae bacterium]
MNLRSLRLGIPKFCFIALLSASSANAFDWWWSKPSFSPEETKVFEDAKAAAKSGRNDAVRNLGVCYAAGIGVATNFQTATEYYLDACNRGSGTNGDVLARTFLALNYLNGQGTEQDISVGIDLLKTSANLGDVFAQEFLGDIYSSGLPGEKKDLVQAYKWYSCAMLSKDVERFNTERENRVTERFNSIRKQMTEPEICEADGIAKATLWSLYLRPSPYEGVNITMPAKPSAGNPVASDNAVTPSESVSISAADAQSHIGEMETVEGAVSEVKVTAKAVFLDIDGIYPNEALTAVYFGKNREWFTSFRGKKVLVTGIIRQYKSKPEIVVRSRSAITEAR